LREVMTSGGAAWISDRLSPKVSTGAKRASRLDLKKLGQSSG
jgi:hypothetical protein